MILNEDSDIEVRFERAIGISRWPRRINNIDRLDISLFNNFTDSLFVWYRLLQKRN